MVIPDTEKLVYEIDGDIIFKPVAPIRKPKPKGGDSNALSPKTETPVGALTDEKNSQQLLPIVTTLTTTNKE